MQFFIEFLFGFKNSMCWYYEVLTWLILMRKSSQVHTFLMHIFAFWGWKVLCFKVMRYWHDWFSPILFMSSAKASSEKPSHRGKVLNWIWVKFGICSTSCVGTLSNTTMDSRSCDPCLVGFDSMYNVVMLHCRLPFWASAPFQLCPLCEEGENQRLRVRHHHSLLERTNNMFRKNNLFHESQISRCRHFDSDT